MVSLVVEYCSWDVLKDCLGYIDSIILKIYCYLILIEKLKFLIVFNFLEG